MSYESLWFEKFQAAKLSGVLKAFSLRAGHLKSVKILTFKNCSKEVETL